MPSPRRHGAPSRRAPAIALAALVMAVASCSSEDGRELPAPDPDQTTTSSAAPALDSAPAGDVAEVFSISSPALAPGAAVPVQFTCDGTDISPPVTWASTPPAAELALVMRDPDADGFVHWVVTGIDPLVQGFGEGGVSESALELANSTGTIGWSGPCPPAGSTHTYELTLYALPEPLVPDQSIPAADIVRLLEGAASARATLTFTYGR